MAEAAILAMVDRRHLVDADVGGEMTRREHAAKN